MQDRLKHLLSLKDFADVLSLRINCIYEEDKRIMLEKNFKACAKKQRQEASKNNSSYNKINLTLVVRKWLDMYVYRHCNKYLCAGDETSRFEIDHFLSISTMLVSCMSMFIIGLGQIWFFNEYTCLRNINTCQDVDEMNKISSKSILFFTCVNVFYIFFSLSLKGIEPALDWLCKTMYTTFISPDQTGLVRINTKQVMPVIEKKPSSIECSSSKQRRDKMLPSPIVTDQDVIDDCVMGKWSADYDRVHAETIAFLKQFI